MLRRSFLKQIPQVGLASGVLLGMGALKAQEAELTETGQITLNSEISANHGHQLELSPAEALTALRTSLNDSMPVTLDIQGQSGHPHSVTLSSKNLLDLFLNGEIQLGSSTNAGHSHNLNIELGV